MWIAPYVTLIPEFHIYLFHFRYTSAEVVDKEYCQAKKSENRFRVPQGTKFYRVRCKPATIKDKDIMTKSNGKND